MTHPSKKQLRVFALTGGIGSGKSSVAQFLREEGVPVVDADQLARQVVAPGTPGLKAVVQTFGEGCLDIQGGLDRKKLGALVFADASKRELLERILHPLIQKVAEREFERLSLRGDLLICYEVPLLFETKQQERYRPVLLVSAEPEFQLTRVMSRDGVPRDVAQARIDAQLPLEEKREGADICIENNSSLEDLRERTVVALEELRAWC